MNFGSVVAIFTGLLSLATVAVLVSQNAQTSRVIQSLGTAVGTSIGAAVSPVTGGSNSSQPGVG